MTTAHLALALQTAVRDADAAAFAHGKSFAVLGPVNWRTKQALTERNEARRVVDRLLAELAKGAAA